MTAAYLYDAVRTPFGRFNGALAGVRPDDLASYVIKALLDRHPHLDGGLIDEVIFGNANGAGKDNRNLGRMAGLLTGLPVTVPLPSTGSAARSLDAAMIASRSIETGDAEVMIAGGAESMTRSPWVLMKPDNPFPVDDNTAVSTAFGWRLINKRMPPEWTVSLGESNEQLREKFNIARERQDAFACRSHRLAHQAWQDGFYDDIVTSVPEIVLARDEGIRSGVREPCVHRLRCLPAY
jgi:acetyl-CoA acyltransferase